MTSSFMHSVPSGKRRQEGGRGEEGGGGRGVGRWREVGGRRKGRREKREERRGGADVVDRFVASSSQCIPIDPLKAVCLVDSILRVA